MKIETDEKFSALCGLALRARDVPARQHVYRHSMKNPNHIACDVEAENLLGTSTLQYKQTQTKKKPLDITIKLNLESRKRKFQPAIAHLAMLKNKTSIHTHAGTAAAESQAPATGRDS